MPSWSCCTPSWSCCRSSSSVVRVGEGENSRGSLQKSFGVRIFCRAMSAIALEFWNARWAVSAYRVMPSPPSLAGSATRSWSSGLSSWDPWRCLTICNSLRSISWSSSCRPSGSIVLGRCRSSELVLARSSSRACCLGRSCSRPSTCCNSSILFRRNSFLLSRGPTNEPRTLSPV